jgi:hypothetical protein
MVFDDKSEFRTEFIPCTCTEACPPYCSCADDCHCRACANVDWGSGIFNEA